MATKLPIRMIEKPWGRTDLPAIFHGGSGRRIGEIWFEDSGDEPLLVKYIFTSERLSIQVHPSHSEAVSRGLPSGKSECWLILDAEPGATIGLGLRRPMSSKDLRSSALDGSIEELMDWRPVSAGDFFYVQPGTVHAIGAGISLLEFQENADITFRLYDYGRPRELHLDDGIAVARSEPYPAELAQHVAPSETRVLADGPYFSLVHVAPDGSPNDYAVERRRWIMPLSGEASCGGVIAVPGECLLAEAGERLEEGAGLLLIGCEGSLIA